MNERDKQIVSHVNSHYSEILENMQIVDSCDKMIDPKNKNILKAIKMDLAQIGENIIHLSNESKSQIDKGDLKGITDIRNYIVHGYIVIKDSTIFRTIKNDLPRLVEQINKIN